MCVFTIIIKNLASVDKTILCFILSSQVLRCLNDANLRALPEKTAIDYVIQQALSKEALRDEILCQLCNQTYKNDNHESEIKAWIMMADALSCFHPTDSLYKYLLKYVSDSAPDSFRSTCQHKLLRSAHIPSLNARVYPPTLLEHTANSRQTGIALEGSLPNGESRAVTLDSWTTGEEFAADLLRAKNVKNSFGWTTEMLDDDDIFELNGSDYVLDLIAETEVPPSFATCKSYFLGSSDRSKPRKNRSRLHDASHFNVIDADLMSQLAMEREKKPERIYESRSAMKSSSQEHLLRSHHHLSNSVQSLDRNNVSLSRNSRLNQRYLSNGVKNNKMNGAVKQTGVTKQRYLMPKQQHASKLSNGDASLKAKSLSMQDLGLATSALNERYFFNQQDMQKSISVTSKTGDLDTMTILKPANDRCFIADSNDLTHQKSQFMASMVRPSSRSSSSLSSDGSGHHHNGSGHQVSDSSSINARYVKYPGKQNGRGHSHGHSTKAYIDRNDRGNDLDNYSIGPRSSAMSDTSEAPSLASHVRNVKIPSLVSDLDQYLDDLFNPVLDGNLDELSDARSLAASIKGSGKPGILDSLDIDTSEVNGLCGSSSSIVRKLKGGGVRPGVPSQVSLKKVTASDQSSSNTSDSAFTNVAGMTVPIVGTTKVIQQQLVHQQMIQRAFLASAVQQNLQMQQQLLEQNEALQKLLQANPNDEAALASLSSLMQQGIDSGISLSTISGLSPSSSSSMQPDISMLSPNPRSSRVIPAPPPPPPPSPPPISPTGSNFPMDVYGRAKTVRIGKWRWPPAREDSEKDKESNSFLEFKMKKNHEKTSGEEGDQPQQQQSAVRSNQTSQEPSTTTKYSPAVNTSLNQESSTKIHTKEGEIILLKNKAKASTTTTSNQSPVTSLVSNNIASSNASNNIRNSSSGTTGVKQANSSSQSQAVESRETKTDSSVGKLRISLEMKAKLEQLTTDQTTVRSGKPSCRERLNRSMDDISDAGVKKLSETRKSLLEQQLLGSLRLPGQAAPVKPPIDVIDKLVMARSHENISHSEADGLVRIEGRFAPNRRSMSREHRERKDELGPRTKSHGPASTVNAEYGDDDVSRSLSDNFFDDSTMQNGSVNSSRVKRMGIPPPPPPNHHRSQEIYSTRPQTSCSSIARGMTPLVVKKREAPPLPSNIKSISHDRLDLRSDFGESDFLSTMGGSTLANDKGYQSDATATRTKLYPPDNSVFLTYNRVNWELRLRKEFFYPGEKIEDPMTLNLIFCQIVRDAFCRHLIRLSREDREQLQAQLRNYGITKDNVLSGVHKLTTQRSVVDFAKELPTYFCRLYPISGGRKLPNVNLLGISHSGVKFVQRDKDLPTPNDHLKIVEALQSVYYYHFFS